MKSLRLSGLLVLLGAGIACSSNPGPQAAYDHSVDFKDLKKYEWYAEPTEQKAVGGAVVDQTFVENHIRADADKILIKRNYMPVPEGTPPDFLIEFHTRAAGVLERDQYGLYAWGPIGAEYYKAATLVLDVRNPDKTLLWRGWYTLTLGRNPEAIARNIRTAVSKVLGNFPPKPVKG